MQEIANRIIKTELVEWRSLSWLQNRSLKEMTKESFERLKNSLRNNSFIMPFNVWDDGEKIWILDGHHRERALKELEKDSCRIPDLLPANFIGCRDRREAVKLVLVYSSIYANVTSEGLYETLSVEGLSLDDIRFDLNLPEIDFEKFEQEFYKDQDDSKDDEIPPIPEIPKTKTGDLWLLGNHRLLCGDSTKREDMERLMDGKKADMVLTSPPYAVGKEYEKEISFGDHLNLLRRFADQAIINTKPGGFIFINFGEIASLSHTSLLTGSKKQCIYPISKDYWQIFHVERDCDLYAQRIWYKPFNRLQQPFWSYHTSIPHYQEWEHIWTWRIPGGNSDNCFDWDISVHAVWDTRNEAVDDKPLTRHVAAFPVCLPERAIKAHSDKENIIFDPFGGAGTTLIACEKLNRKCVIIEIKPIYCDIILDRWANYTGKDPIRDDGMKWSELKNAMDSNPT